MKKYVYVLVAVLGLNLTACGNANKKTTTEAADTVAVAVNGAQYVEDLLASAETNIGKKNHPARIHHTYLQTLRKEMLRSG
ncbi:hypothetical protein ACIXGS_21240 [Bacteroides fragilis]